MQQEISNSLFLQINIFPSFVPENNIKKAVTGKPSEGGEEAGRSTERKTATRKVAI